MHPTSTKIKEFLAKFGLYPNVVSFRNGRYKIKRSYHIGAHRILSAMLENLKDVPNITVVDSGDHFHAFVGGAKSGSAQDSYVWVEFTLNDNFKLD